MAATNPAVSCFRSYVGEILECSVAIKVVAKMGSQMGLAPTVRSASMNRCSTSPWSKNQPVSDVQRSTSEPIVVGAGPVLGQNCWPPPTPCAQQLATKTPSRSSFSSINSRKVWLSHSWVTASTAAGVFSAAAR